MKKATEVVKNLSSIFHQLKKDRENATDRDRSFTEMIYDMFKSIPDSIDKEML